MGSSKMLKAEHKLAPELWHTIIALLRSDKGCLAQLSLVSSHLLELARPYYYGEVEVIAWYHTMTLHLLARSPDLAKSIVRLKVLMPPVPRWGHENGFPWPAVRNKVVLAAIFNMTSLEELEMTGLIFSFESEQKRLLEHFKTREKPLRRLSFREAPGAQLFPGDTFDLPGLTHLSWSSYRDRE
jgi:hypothetical protein